MEAVVGTVQASVKVSAVPKIRNEIGATRLHTCNVEKCVFFNRIKTSNPLTVGVERPGASLRAPRCSLSTPSPSYLHGVTRHTSNDLIESSPNKVPPVISPGDLDNGDPLLGIWKTRSKEAEKMKVWIEEIRAMFRSMQDNKILISSYNTTNEKAVGYPQRLRDRFNDAASNVYPVDFSERMWMIDLLERLGIARYFKKEIKDSLDYLFKCFTSDGIASARGADVQHLDDTAMGFRLLRLHGYDVNENVFQQFTDGNGDFVCFAGQSSLDVAGLFNLYRAAQARFPGESLLEGAERFARNFLQDKYSKNECFDKQTITKDIAGEVGYALETPWYCSLPRIENQSCLSQYGPEDDWIGKTFNRMPYVSKYAFLALAKADFNLCQSHHEDDLQTILRWNQECKFGQLTFSRQKAYESFFTAASVFPAPELTTARLVWTQNCVLTTVIDDFFDVGGTIPDMQKILAAVKEWDSVLMDGASDDAKLLFFGLYNSINEMTRKGMLAQGRDIGPHLRNIWVKLLESYMTEAKWRASGYWPSLEEYFDVSLTSMAMEPIVSSAMFFLGEPVSDELLNDPKILHLKELVNRASRLVNDMQGHQVDSALGKPTTVTILLKENPNWTKEDVVAKIRAIVGDVMRNLACEVHQTSHIPVSIKQAHFNMARVMQFFYKDTDCFTSPTATTKSLVNRILFQPVS